MSAKGFDYYEGANHKLIAMVPKEAKRILDIGCAKGMLGAVLKSQDSEREVWGIELVPEVAKEAASRLDHVLAGDIEKMDPLPLPDAYFDNVICGDVLEHMIRPEHVLVRLKKHLKPEGQLLCSVPNIGHWSIIVGLLQGRFDYTDKGLLDRTHVSFFTPQTLREMLWDVGYMVVHEDASMTPHPPFGAVLAEAGTKLGIAQDQLLTDLTTYQQVYGARVKPNALDEPEKLIALLGPHVGKLGIASKHCSIVIVTYNSAATIEGCLQTLLETLSPDDEVIVVDNASKDETLVRIAEVVHDPRIKVIANKVNIGFSRGANVGVLASSGEYVVLLNPDTRVWPGWLGRLSATFDNPMVGAVGPIADNVSGDQFVGRHMPHWKPTVALDDISRFISALPMERQMTRLLIGCCLMLRRPILDQYGLLEEACFLGADDLELSWRYQELGLTLQIACNVFIAHHGGSSFASISSSERTNSIRQSDQALIAKLKSYYGRLPSSQDIWRNSIFSDALRLL